MAGFAVIEFLGEGKPFNPVQIYKEEKLEFDSPSNFQVANGQIIVGVSTTIKSINIEKNETGKLYEADEDSEFKFDIVAAAPLNADIQLILAASKSQNVIYAIRRKDRL